MSVTRGQCDARHTVTFPAEASLPIGRYQIILLGDRGTCVLNNLPRVALDCGEARIRTRDLLITSLAS